MRFENNGPIIFAEEFGRATAMINPVAVAQFFEAVCTGISKRLLATGSIKDSLLGPVLMYFGTVEINNQGILHLHCLV